MATAPRDLRRAWAVLSAGLMIMVGVAGGPSPRVAAAPIPVLPFPTLEPERVISTNPFAGSTKHPGDVEGLAYDPVAKTMWISDDSRSQLYEIDYTTGTLIQTITPAMLAATLRYGSGGVPTAPAAGDSRAGDLEAMAYDAKRDHLYAFGGNCCPPLKPHDPAVFRLVRGAGGHFQLESYQPLLSDGRLNDFSGVGAINGQLWAGLDQTLYRYDYAANTFPESVGPLPIGDGKLNGVGFSADAAHVWLTANNDRLYRVTWPGLKLVPDHDFSMLAIGLADVRAVEIVGDEVVLADGYDYYPPGTTEEFALRVYKLVKRAPTASFVTNPSTGTGGVPLVVGFTDTSAGRPASWRWDFGDGSTSSEQHPSHTYKAARAYTVKLTVTNPHGSSSATSVVTGTTAAPIGYVGISPARLLDTRAAPTVDGRFQGLGPLGPTATVHVAVVGRAGVPAAGVSAVVLNVTATGASRDSYMTVWPRGGSQPTASNLNYAAGTTRANLVMVPVGAGGEVSIYNDSGSTGVVVDLLGYVPTAPARATPSFVGLSPVRLLDSRDSPTVDGRFRATGAFAGGQIVELDVAGRGGVPAGGAGSVALNVTAVGPTVESYMTVWPAGAAQPTASNLNYRPGETVANMVIVPLGRDGRLSLFNAAGSTDVVIDVLGWFPAGGEFVGLTPGRLMDSRTGGSTVDHGQEGGGAMGAGSSRDVRVIGRGGTPVAGAGSVVLNVTAVGATAESYMTVWPAGVAQPTASNLNFRAGQTVPNLVIVPIGAGGVVRLYNDAGAADVLVDVLGYFPT